MFTGKHVQPQAECSCSMANSCVHLGACSHVSDCYLSSRKLLFLPATRSALCAESPLLSQYRRTMLDMHFKKENDSAGYQGTHMLLSKLLDLVASDVFDLSLCDASMQM